MTNNQYIVALPTTQVAMPYYSSVSGQHDEQTWVSGKLTSKAAAHKFDTADLPPSLYQEVRDDITKMAGIPVSRVALRRHGESYVGVIDSNNTPFWFSLSSLGLKTRSVEKPEFAWEAFETLMSKERKAALERRREHAARDFKDYVITLSKGLTFKQPNVSGVGTHKHNVGGFHINGVSGHSHPLYNVPLIPCQYGGGKKCKAEGGDGAKKHKFGYIHPNDHDDDDTEDDEPHDTEEPFNADDTTAVKTTKPLMYGYSATMLPKLGQAAGGSNGSQIVTGPGGKKWLLKTYKGNTDRVATELAANAIYRAMGVKVPDAGVKLIDGKAALAYPLVDGETRTGIKDSTALGDHYMVDALLANWDFIGLTEDNVLWDKEGNPTRIDHGGTMSYRAQGGPKSFSATDVPEVLSMLLPGKGQGHGRIKVTATGLRKQALAIANTLTNDTIDAIMDGAPFANEQMRESNRAALKGRVAWMRNFAKNGPSPDLKELLDGSSSKMETSTLKKVVNSPKFSHIPKHKFGPLVVHQEVEGFCAFGGGSECTKHGGDGALWHKKNYEHPIETEDKEFLDLQAFHEHVKKHAEKAAAEDWSWEKYADTAVTPEVKEQDRQILSSWVGDSCGKGGASLIVALDNLGMIKGYNNYFKTTYIKKSSSFRPLPGMHITELAVLARYEYTQAKLRKMYPSGFMPLSRGTGYRSHDPVAEVNRSAKKSYAKTKAALQEAGPDDWLEFGQNPLTSYATQGYIPNSFRDGICLDKMTPIENVLVNEDTGGTPFYEKESIVITPEGTTAIRKRDIYFGHATEEHKSTGTKEKYVNALDVYKALVKAMSERKIRAGNLDEHGGHNWMQRARKQARINRPFAPGTAANMKKALPKKDKSEPAKKAKKVGKHEGKKVGKNGQTRYNYAADKQTKSKSGGGSAKKPGAKGPDAQQQTGKPGTDPIPVPDAPRTPKSADPQHLANQLQMPLSTLQQIAKKFHTNEKLGGSKGFAQFMRVNCKDFNAKHKLTTDYWNVIYSALTGGGALSVKNH